MPHFITSTENLLNNNVNGYVDNDYISLQDFTKKQNVINLLDVLTSQTNDTSTDWRVHNCKLTQESCQQQGTLEFLYHYDTLSELLKHEHPMDAKLLKHFNQKMTAEEAENLIGVPHGSIKKPWFVKLSGSLVIFNEKLQLAIRMNWSNTIKPQDTVYCQTQEQAKKAAINNWQFVGRMDVLNKMRSSRINSKNNQESSLFAIINEDSLNPKDAVFPILYSESYQPIPNTTAISFLTQLNLQKEKLSIIDSAIKNRVS